MFPRNLSNERRKRRKEEGKKIKNKTRWKGYERAKWKGEDRETDWNLNKGKELRKTRDSLPWIKKIQGR